MPKLYVNLSSIQPHHDHVSLIYSVVIQDGESISSYGGDFKLDDSVSLGENLSRMKHKIMECDYQHGSDLHPGDVIIFGAPILDSPEAMDCCSHGITSVNRSISWKPSGLGSMVKSFFTPPEPVVQVVQEKDPRVEEHAQKIQELGSQLDSIKAGILLVQEELKTLISDHDHPYPERTVQLEGEVNSVLGKLHQHREHTSDLYEEVMHRIHALENPPKKEESVIEVIEEKVEEEVKEVIEEAIPVIEKPIEDTKGVWQRFERWVQNLWV